MSKKLCPKKMLDILIDIYEQTKEQKKVSVSLIIKSYNTGSYILPVLIDAGILKKHQKGEYEWKSIRPNIQMANKVIEKVSEKNKLNQKKQIKNIDSVDTNDFFEEKIIYPFDNIDSLVETLTLENEELSKLNKLIVTENSKLTEQVIKLRDENKSLKKEDSKPGYTIFNHLDNEDKKIILSEKPCKNCDDTFEQKHVLSQYCSDSCRYEYNNRKKKNLKELSIFWGLIKIKR